MKQQTNDTNNKKQKVYFYYSVMYSLLLFIGKPIVAYHLNRYQTKSRELITTYNRMHCEIVLEPLFTQEGIITKKKKNYHDNNYSKSPQKTLNHNEKYYHFTLFIIPSVTKILSRSKVLFQKKIHLKQKVTRIIT